MKMRTIYLHLAAALVLASTTGPLPAQPASKSTDRPSVKDVPPSKPPSGIPADSKYVEVGTWRHVDAQGKAWLYKKTPFGVMKNPEGAQEARDKRAAEVAPDPTVLIKVQEEDDTLKFSRPGPFGVYTWKKKKTDLSADEKKVWERTQAAKGKQE